jgi:hypothetical protein
VERNDFPSGLTRRQRQFLRAFVECGSVQGAADSVGISRQTHYVWLKKPVYRDAYEQAQEMAADRLISEAYKRALDRRDRASPYLLTFLIKRLRPEFGVSRVEVTQVLRERELTEAEIDAEIARLLSALGYQKTDSPSSDSRSTGTSTT